MNALEELYYYTDQYRTGDSFNELFKFICRLPTIAPFNAMLLHIQKPGITAVATAAEWKKQFGRSIRPGARPLVILWPFAPVEFVYEAADTIGETDLPESIMTPFQASGTLPPLALKRLINNLKRDNVTYYEADHGSGSAGLIRLYPDGSFEMIVNQNHSPEQRFATIAHELGHLYCGHLGPQDAPWWPCRTNLPHIVKEFEAESVAWLVCKRAGIRPYSEQYLGNLSAFEEMPPVNLELVLIAAGLIESMAERSLGKRKEKKKGRSYSNRSRFTASWDSLRPG